MKSKKDLILIGTFVVVFIVLSFFLYFFIRESSYEQAIGGGLQVTRPIEEEPPASFDEEPRTPSPLVTQETPDTQNAPTAGVKEPVIEKNYEIPQEVSKTLPEKEPKLLAIKLSENPKVNSARNNANILEGNTTLKLKRGETLWEAARTTGTKNPWRWTDILELNRKKVDYVYFDEDKNFWFVIVKQGTQLTIPKEDIKIKAGNQNWTKYALQLAAYSEAEKKQAFAFVETLLEDGFFAYVYKTDKKIRSKNNPPQYYYRVRLGFFEDFGTAAEYAELIKKRYQNMAFFDDDYFIVQPSPKEFDGNLLNYGIQMLNPYAVEFSQSETRDDALKLLREVDIDSEHYPYFIKQNIGEERYAVKTGFFSTQQKAQEFIDKLNAKSNNRFAYARLVRIENIHEALAGQNVNFDNPYPGK